MLRIYYTSDHQWINVVSGYCGLTRYAFDMHDPYKIKHELSNFYRVRAGDIHAKILLENTVIGHMISPITGEITQINSHWLPCYTDISWTHRVEIQEYLPTLMTYTQYSKYLGEK